MAGFYSVQNILQGTLTIGNVTLQPQEKRNLYLRDSDETDLAPSRAILIHDSASKSAYDVYGKLVVRDLDPNDTAGGAINSVNGKTGTVVLTAADVDAAAEDHDHAIEADAGSGLASAADLQAAFIAMSARVKALEDAAP